ncbi:hypothetical protein [Nocardioides piscis]|uniref:Uncharacterized protein n=1 Tax=Nocardioides piscis TaxID=2714938 RepID=A0A6G7YGW0_9ACTN|nr:hypothetical protein [Nocardioides piscis]QIK75969.1 hypothetical protein G7071_11485 [Nocardioides piscis]
MSFNALSIAAAESHGDPAIHPYLVGALTLAILLGLLLALVTFGGGREHS